MAEKIRKRVRRRRRIKSIADLGDLGEKYKPRQLFLLIGGIVVAIALLLVFLHYGTNAYHNWRESRLLKRASIMLEQQDFDGATAAAQQALELHRDSLAAFQVLAEATEKQNRIETVAWRAQIARLLPQKLDSHLNLASAALRFGELDTARKALEHVSPNDRDRAAYHVVAGWLARAQGDEGGLQQHFAAALQQEPNNELFQFNLAVLQIKSVDPGKRESARQMLDRLSKTAPFRTGALRALLNDAVIHGDLPAADGLAQDLQMSQQVTFGDYLLCLNLYRKLDEKKFAALLEKVKPVATRQATDLASLMDWMNNNGLAADVLKWIEKLPSDLTTSPPPSIAVAEAFTQVKNWSRLKRWTKGGSWNDSDYFRLAYQAYAARNMRQGSNDAEFDSLWRAAERAAGEEADRQLTLARLAERWKLSIEAEQLWLRVVKNNPARRESLEALARIYRARNDLPNLYRTMQRLHEASPADPGAAANYARLALLLEQNAAEGHRVAKEAYDRAPNDVNCGLTYAFSLYGLGRTAEGVEIMKTFSPEQLHDPHAAAYAAVLLVDENMLDAAQDYIETARRGPLFAEEKKLLDETLNKASGGPNASAPAQTPTVISPSIMETIPLASPASPTPPPRVSPRPTQKMQTMTPPLPLPPTPTPSD